MRELFAIRYSLLALHQRSSTVILGMGSDIVDIRRIERTLERFGERFTQRIYTEIERRKSDRRAARAASYAKRFAAKEACAKALGTGFPQERLLARSRRGERALRKTPPWCFKVPRASTFAWFRPAMSRSST